MALVISLTAALAWVAQSRALADQADAETAIRLAADAYAHAFNSGSMEDLAAQWAEQAELVEADMQLVGRDAIMTAIAASRARLPQAEMTIEIADIRFITPSLARVSGTLTISATERGPQISSEFTSLRVLEGDQWLLAESIVTTMPQASLGDVSWMTGTWEGTTPGGEPLRIDVTQDLDGQAVVSRITVGPADEPLVTAIDVIHADAASGRLRSWTFDSTGARAEGVLVSNGTSFNRIVEGISAPDSGGLESTWVQVITPLDEHRLVLQSIERTLEGETLPDSDAIILKKAAASATDGPHRY